jgi:ATP-dependent Clp protease protease subunit
VTGGSRFTESVAGALLARRIVLVRGLLDDAQASDVAAALMTLDATGDEHIELRIGPADGTVEAGLAVTDVMAVLGVPVHTVGLGVVAGGAVALLAAGGPRLVTRHARLHLREPDSSVLGNASAIERAVAEQAARRALFHELLARCTGRPLDHVALEWSQGRFVEAGDAVTLGYADSLQG